jgi:predicted pyridoxine 5'-phosphate oxidase superfamily flavin-nucleotide-binding protein
MTQGAAIDEAARWHAGERAVQKTIGADVVFEGLESRIFHTQMSEQQRVFFAGLRFLVVGSVDAKGDAWATTVSGHPGFLSSPNVKTLRISAGFFPDDPAREGLFSSASVALLGIDFATRRRYRLNGYVIDFSERAIVVRAAQVFGNCPKYIKVRHFVGEPLLPKAEERLEKLETLSGKARALIEDAETFFVASYVDLPRVGRQVDVSHRGGPAGFVHVTCDGQLIVPDYVGNRFFNTLGNFSLNPRAGLAFVDFEAGTVLQLSGDVTLVLDGPEIDTLPGAERLWKFHPRTILRRRFAMAINKEVATDVV